MIHFANIIATLGLIILALALALFPLLCLWRIARKTRIDEAWMAWIPGINVWALCRIGRLPEWHGLIAIAGICGGQALNAGGLTPWAVIVAVIGVVWYCYILLKVPPALGITGATRFLIVVPVVNYIYIGYLAFRKETVAVH